jgi:ParB/RepB/Spo0J family partition protein
MISQQLETDGHSTAQPGSPSGLPVPEDMQTLAPQRLEVGQIDLRMARWRLPNPRDFQQLHDLVHGEGRIRDPVLVSAAVAPGHWVLVDGFKRLRVAQKMGLTHLWVQVVQLDEAHAKAMMFQCNQPRAGLSKLEEAWIVRSLCVDHAMRQTEVAELLKRGKSWVCRQLQLAKSLDKSVQDMVKEGNLSATTACTLSQLQRGNQQPVARAIVDHALSSRECTQLLEKLRDTGDEQARHEVLADPRRFIDPSGRETGDTGGSDPRLSKDGNRLRRSLLSWERACSRLTDELRRAAADDARALAPLIQDAVTAGTRAVRQLEATHSSCGVHLRPMQSESDCASPAP